ncbi:MAG TPA: leucine--tRNA ligase, partial [Patescibacteria group bacterium]
MADDSNFFKETEKKWQEFWDKHPEINQAQNVSSREKKYVLVEFPYPSGSGLHVGHAFTFTGGDVYARRQRMKGYNVLFPMGWDAFGLPTENYAIKTKQKPQEVTKKNTDMFRSQMKRLAFSFDWSREVNTTDPGYYKWTQWIFIQLFKKGLAYKQEMPINWCPSCKIGLANEEVVNGRCERCGTEVERRTISQWVVKITDYADKLVEGLKDTDFIEKVKAAQVNWIGKSEGARVRFKLKDGDKELEVFTTRPDTLYGATFMVVAPEHELISRLTNNELRISQDENENKKRVEEIKNYVKQARSKSDLERTELSKDKTGVFSGLYAVNPLTGKEIPVWISDFVLASYGTGAIMSVPAHDERDFAFAQKFGLPITPVISPEKEWDFQKEAYTDVNNGKMINSPEWNGLKPDEAIKKAIEWIKEKGIGEGTSSYHLRDWIFSRQHYWGEPIPMIYCENHGWQPVA